MNSMSTDYLTGIIDGEGSIMMGRAASNSQYRYPVISVTNSSRAIISWLHDTHGGMVVVQKKYAEHHKQCWIWSVRYRQAIDICALIAPHLLDEDKSRRANMLVQRYDQVTKRNGKYNAEERQRKLDFEQEFLGRFD